MNTSRSDARNNSWVSDTLRLSLCCMSRADRKSQLQLAATNTRTSPEFQLRSRALLSVLEYLEVLSSCSLIELVDVYESSTDHLLCSNSFDSCKRLIDIMLSEKHGLPVMILSLENDRIVFLKDTSAESLQHLFIKLSSSSGSVRQGDQELLGMLLQSMSSEFDRKCARVLCSLIASPSQLSHAGFRPDKIEREQVALHPVLLHVNSLQEDAQRDVTESIARRVASLSSRISFEQMALKRRFYKLDPEIADDCRQVTRFPSFLS